MRILVAGGGTAGHINPALAIAGKIKEKDKSAEILFVGRPEGMESILVPKAGYNYATMEVAGFQRKLSAENLKRNLQAVGYLISSGSKAEKIINEFKPDIGIGTGGYVSGPILRKAAQKGIPIIIHEQNAFPGVTTKMLSRYAECVMLAVEDAKKHLGSEVKWEVTGNPLRADVLTYSRVAARKELELDERPLVLSFGGSLGARAINEALIPFLAKSGKEGKYNHIHAYGQYGRWLPEKVEELGVKIKQCSNLDIREYIEDMPRVLAAADLVICRAGAITLSELQAQGKASVLIPSPNVAENHQFHNAMALVKRHAASIIEENELNGEKLIETAEGLLNSPEELRQMGVNAQKMAIVDSSDRIYSIIQKIASKI
ncbi:MAG: undecaprenyldiphospho-muramoylpentapeptide beta-N-acetylglucosaminyltransferase [Oscillospiraceae bacterium]|jgi:UDP-N-acetylglucosamine--N-acetylmuramyl-(pentapeptide) pyrophosphoryl-undecaprenol N-acetylglucosamine transferase|nr:undecaprenyldiphospho-muramoylpentapeptide beta-N-acetylglucosaminyltransferase [Oscillospiraceae bacterium]